MTSPYRGQQAIRPARTQPVPLYSRRHAESGRFAGAHRLRAEASSACLDARAARLRRGHRGLARRGRAAGRDRRGGVSVHQGLSALPVQRLRQAHCDRRRHCLRRLARRDQGELAATLGLPPQRNPGHPSALAARPLHPAWRRASRCGRGPDGHARGDRRRHLQLPGPARLHRGTSASRQARSQP
jgi:hypothetical protein